MLDPRSLLFDKFNVWRELWYYPTDRELYIISNDCEIAVKICVIVNPEEWPMYSFRCIANVLPVKKIEAFNIILQAWQARVLDQLVDTDTERLHERNAVWDN